RHIDRRFLTELDKSDWLEAANELKQKLTDNAIEESLKKLPDTIYSMYSDTLGTILKQRRDLLDDYAERYYHILAKEVDVVGSDEHEMFMVERIQDGKTKVQMYKTDDDGEEQKDLLYERIFLPEETKEIRLYGFE